jgi:hypothetical protein
VSEALTVDPGVRKERSPGFEAVLVRLREALATLQDSMTAPTSWLFVKLQQRFLSFRWQQAHPPRQVILDAVLATASLVPSGPALP